MKMNKPKIFISHSWEDNPFAYRLEADLKSAGADVWIDYNETRGGDNLPDRLGEALEWCDILLLVWSETAESSAWVKLEWSNAISLRKKIIPCKVGKNKLPVVLSCKVYIDFLDYESGLSQLLRALMLGDQSKMDTSIGTQITIKDSHPSIHNDINKISKLFKMRDEAVLEKDRKKFLGTQVNDQEIKDGFSKGYLACTKVTTSILNIAANGFKDEIPVSYTALVKEDYEHDDQFTHSGYIIYTFSKINEDFRIAALQTVIAFP